MTSTSGRVLGRWRVGDHGAFLAFIEAYPAGVQTPVRGLPPRGPRATPRPSSAQLAPRPIPGSVMPRGFDQQSAGMAVAGVGDPAPGADDGARGVLGGHQPKVGADGPAGPAAPVPDLGGQPERGQRRDPAQAPQPGHYRGVGTVGGHLRDRGIQTVPAIQGGQHGVERGVIGQLQARRGEGVRPQPQFVLAGPCLPAGVDDPLPQQQFRETMPGRSVRPPTSPPPPRQRPDPLHGLVVIGGQPALEHLAGLTVQAHATTDRACTSNPTLVR